MPRQEQKNASSFANLPNSERTGFSSESEIRPSVSQAEIPGFKNLPYSESTYLLPNNDDSPVTTPTTTPFSTPPKKGACFFDGPIEHRSPIKKMDEAIHDMHPITSDYR